MMMTKNGQMTQILHKRSPDGLYTNKKVFHVFYNEATANLNVLIH